MPLLLLKVSSVKVRLSLQRAKDSFDNVYVGVKPGQMLLDLMMRMDSAHIKVCATAPAVGLLLCGWRVHATIAIVQAARTRQYLRSHSLGCCCPSLQSSSRGTLGTKPHQTKTTLLLQNILIHKSTVTELDALFTA